MTHRPCPLNPDVEVDRAMEAARAATVKLRQTMDSRASELLAELYR